MADHDKTFDDELLSAYLDDELSAAERARVEARLAADPAVRKLLDELQAVSQATKELPQEKLGGDIRATILRRAERAMLVSDATASGQSAGGVSPLRRISIGRSPRGWFWAGLAVAAALMLMVLQGESERDAGLPGAVARRADDSSELAGEPAGRFELRSAGEQPPVAGQTPPAIDKGIAAGEALPLAAAEVAAPSSPASAPAVAGPASGVARRIAESNDDTDRGRGGSALARSESSPHLADIATTTNEPQSRAPAAADRRESQVGRTAGLGGVITESDAGGIDDADLVVHLEMKPEALSQKVFDATLLRCNIVIEEAEAAHEESLARDDRSEAALADLRQATDKIAASTTASPNEPKQVEVVLVEAQRAQIESCLAEIDADAENFLGIAVDEPLTPMKKLAAKELAGVDWKQYDRGQVPQQRKLERAADASYYLQTERGPIVVGHRFGGEENVAKQQVLAEDVASGSDRGRARRLQFFAEAQPELDATQRADRRLKEDASSASTAETQWGLARRGVVTWPKAKPDQLQVLFVLQAGNEESR